MVTRGLNVHVFCIHGLLWLLDGARKEHVFVYRILNPVGIHSMLKYIAHKRYAHKERTANSFVWYLNKDLQKRKVFYIIQQMMCLKQNLDILWAIDVAKLIQYQDGLSRLLCTCICLVLHDQWQIFP